MDIPWSAPIPFEPQAIETGVPDSPGVYQIMQSRSYPRYQGPTDVIKIGMSATSLRQEIDNHFQRHTAANRLRRIGRRNGIEVSVIYAPTDAKAAGELEKELLRVFEDEHWDLPVLNSQRGYSRGEDNHFRG